MADADARFKVVNGALQAAQDTFTMLAAEVATNIAQRLVDEEEVLDVMLRRYDMLSQRQRRCEAARRTLEDLEDALSAVEGGDDD